VALSWSIFDLGLTSHRLQSFPYLADSKKATGTCALAPRLPRSRSPLSRLAGGGDVPAFVWHIFDQDQPLEILGVHIVPLPGPSLPPSRPSSVAYVPRAPVHHGKVFSTPPSPYYCLGFLFNCKIAYLSDVSFVPEEVWSLLEAECTLPAEWRPKTAGCAALDESLNKLDVATKQTKPVIQALVIDCLRIETFTSHFGLGEAVATARRMGALRTYLVSLCLFTCISCPR
jgi:hypothetical protein